MRLSKAIIILLTSLFVFSANAKGETVKLIETEGTVGGMPAPMFLGEDIKYSLPLFVFRTTQYLKFRLKKEEKLLHKKAVFFMLENAELGKIVSWYSDKRLANGKVRVIHQYPISDGYCRTYQAYIIVNGKERHMTNNACTSGTSPGHWSFYR